MSLQDLVLQTSTNAIAISVSRIIYRPNHVERSESEAMKISWSPTVDLQGTSPLEQLAFYFSIRSSRKLKGFIESFLSNQRVTEEKPYKLVGTIPHLRVEKSSRDETAGSGVRRSGLFVSHIRIRSDEIQEGSASLRLVVIYP